MLFESKTWKCLENPQNSTTKNISEKLPFASKNEKCEFRLEKQVQVKFDRLLKSPLNNLLRIHSNIDVFAIDNRVTTAHTHTHIKQLHWAQSTESDLNVNTTMSTMTTTK